MATEADNVNSGALATLLAVGTVAFFGIALVVTALVRAELSEETEKKDVGADRAYRDVAAEQRAKLDAPAAYVDRTKGLVSLPIDRAMELTVEGLKKDPTSATPPAPAAVGGTGGGAPEAAAATGGSGGSSAEGTAPGEASQGGVGAEKPVDGVAKKKDEKKKPAPGAVKPPAPVPAAPAPAPAPAAPPAP